MSKRIFRTLTFFNPDLLQCWIIIAVLAVVGSLLTFGIALTYSIIKGINITNALFSVDGLVSYLLPFIPVIIFLYIAGRSSEKNGKKYQPIDKPDLGEVNPLFLIVTLIMLTFSVGFLIDPLSLIVKIPDNLKAAFENQLASVTGILSIAIAAPICEELLLRGIMERGMLTHYKPVKAILWSAFFFALIHMNLWQGVSAFIIGVLLGWIYYKTHSIWSVIFIHFINNGSSSFFYLLFPNNGIEFSYIKIMPTSLYIVCYAAAIILTAALIFYLHKKLPNKNLFKNEQVIPNNI